ncbi:MAG: response regulator [Phycisphaerae bacterium]|nr:response regulator [Phycisphaerae bacterium]
MSDLKILIADDDPDVLKKLAVWLRTEGHDVTVAHDGYQAVEFARRSRPDLMILDIHMPGGDGFSVQDRTERLAGLEYIPVIYLTHDRSSSTAELVEQHGAVAVLYKPFSTDDLTEAMQRCHARCEAMRHSELDVD